ncbi:universal stress protein [Natronobacterium gregoryi]|uniref:universal stress protein n=1 Tax=Natronobacterium gregoryi TaxID=44930 RepID=UPI00373AEFF8
MSRTVLVPIDGSPLSVRSLRHAFREFPDAAVVASHVVDLFDPDNGVGSVADASLGVRADDRQRRVGQRSRGGDGAAVRRTRGSRRGVRPSRTLVIPRDSSSTMRRSKTSTTS